MRKNTKLINFIIAILFKVIKFLPKIILNIIWTILDASEGKIAILYRYLYMKKYCKTIGERVFIGKSTNIKNHQNLSIGSNVSIHSYNYVDAHGGIKIGDNVSIANHCTIISSDHTWSDEELPIKYNPILRKPIFIASDVWIAAGVRILGDVEIEKRTIVGAGAVVNKSLSGKALYAGVPAKFIKEIDVK